MGPSPRGRAPVGLPGLWNLVLPGKPHAVAAEAKLTERNSTGKTKADSTERGGGLTSLPEVSESCWLYRLCSAYKFRLHQACPVCSRNSPPPAPSYGEHGCLFSKNTSSFLHGQSPSTSAPLPTKARRRKRREDICFFILLLDFLQVAHLQSPPDIFMPWAYELKLIQTAK